MITTQKAIPTNDYLTRLFDLAVASIGCIFLSPFIIAIAIAIKLDDSGPIFYHAKRVGRNGQLFRLYKFRTMVVGADRQGAGVTVAGDRRVTRIGRWLRRLKLDEFPQFLNVLLGDMSLVGPRPEDPRYVALYTPQQLEVLQARPGITSAASLAFRHEEQLLTGEHWETTYRSRIMPTKLAIDLEYLAHRTLWSDAKLIVQTIAVLLQ